MRGAPRLAFLSALIFVVEIFKKSRGKCHRQRDKLVSDGAGVITRRPRAIKRMREPSGPLHAAVAAFMKSQGNVGRRCICCCRMLWNIAQHDGKINEK